MGATADEPIAAFYDLHPYPPPVDDLDALASRSSTGGDDRFAHHLIWPTREPDEIASILVAGCGTAQAARHALRHVDADVVGVDISAKAIEHSRRLAERHGIENLTTRVAPIERVADLGLGFDHVVCTGVLHHLADPLTGLRALRSVLRPGGALTLMVYAPYGRAGVYLMQDYCRRLGVEPTTDEIADLVAVLREIPEGHPVRRLLRSPDFQDDDALADALLNPRDRAYSVPELFDLLDAAGFRFGRWERQAPYVADRGSMSETPHAARVGALPVAEQYAALELFRGTMVRHTAIAYRDDDATSGVLDFGSSAVCEWRPIPAPTALAVEERLPPGAAAALINRAHTDTDLVMFVDRREYRIFQLIDGGRRIAELGPGAAALVERLFRHDLVVIDATGAGT